MIYMSVRIEAKSMNHLQFVTYVHFIKNHIVEKHVVTLRFTFLKSSFFHLLLGHDL